ncbi:MAG: hypothetical protein IKL90_04280 [Alphaproteobacteria bacterium]|nr:hypothetical protein [Alphaproteobacteria bacterium]
MIHKEEKKHIFLKITALLIIGFFVVLAFIEPKPEITHVEKEIKTPIN